MKLKEYSESKEKINLEDKDFIKVSKYISNWNNYYNLKDKQGMEKEYKKIKKQMSTIMALDSTISEAKKIENIHNLLKNKGKECMNCPYSKSCSKG